MPIERQWLAGHGGGDRRRRRVGDNNQVIIYQASSLIWSLPRSLPFLLCRTSGNNRRITRATWMPTYINPAMTMTINIAWRQQRAQRGVLVHVHVHVRLRLLHERAMSRQQACQAGDTHSGLGELRRTTIHLMMIIMIIIAAWRFDYFTNGRYQTIIKYLLLIY